MEDELTIKALRNNSGVGLPMRAAAPVACLLSLGVSRGVFLLPPCISKQAWLLCKRTYKQTEPSLPC